MNYEPYKSWIHTIILWYKGSSCHQQPPHRQERRLLQNQAQQCHTVPVIYSKISQASTPFFKQSVAGIKSLEDTAFPAPFKDRAAEPYALGRSRAIGRKLAVCSGSTSAKSAPSESPLPWSILQLRSRLGTTQPMPQAILDCKCCISIDI